jgi:CRISPR-associated endoribonuclease Cas6
MAIHLIIFLRPEKGITLPQQYNHIVQAAIYNSIDTALATFLHQYGFTDGNRAFKMFAFSLLLGKYRINKEEKTITFEDEVQLTLSSPLGDFCQSLANTLLSRGTLKLGSTDVPVEKVYAQQFKVDKEEVHLKTLSPVVLYSTLLRPDGRKYTCYFQPGEPDYARLLNSNLKKKFKAFYGTEPTEEEVEVRPLGRQRMHLVNYKGTIIKGYAGRLHLSGPVELLQLAVDCGLGGKNAQGFGCVEVVNERKGTTP